MAGAATNPLRIRPLRPGEAWRPCYDQTLHSVGERRFEPRPGYRILGAFRDDRLVGCAEFSTCGLDDLLEACEYHWANPRNGPFFREPSETDTRFLLLHSLWVDPPERYDGVGSALCARLAALGLAAYCEFADEWVCDWFHRCFCPAAE